MKSKKKKKKKKENEKLKKEKKKKRIFKKGMEKACGKRRKEMKNSELR